MAIAIVQSKHVTADTVFTNSYQTQAMTSTPTQNNLLIFFFVFSADNGTITRPTGWLSLAQSTLSGAQTNIGVHYKIAGASEPTQWTWTTDNEIQNARYSIIELSGVDTTTPIDVSGSYGSESFGSTEVTIAAITTVTNGAWDFAVLQCSDGNPFSCSTAGYTEWADSDSRGVYYLEIASAGSTGTRGITNTGSEDRRGFSFAVRPSGGGGGPAATWPGYQSPFGWR